MRFFFVVQDATPVAGEIQLFVSGIHNRRTNTVWIDRQFTKAGYAEREPRLLVSLAKNRSVMAPAAAKVAGLFMESGNLAVQPRRLDASLLCKQSGVEHQDHHDESLHPRDLRCV